MQCVILAAGRGTRMGELTNDIPKPMVSVLGEPLLAHKIRMLPESIDEVILIVGYKKEIIIEYFGVEWEGRRIVFVEHRELNGTAGAIHSAKDIVRGRFLVTMGDNLYCKEDLVKMLSYNVAILVHTTDNPTQFGVIETDDNDRLIDIEEKPEHPKSNLVSTNAFVLDEKFFTYAMVSVNEKEFGLPQTVLVMSREYPVTVCKASWWLPVDNPDDVVLAEQFLVSIFKKSNDMFDGTFDSKKARSNL